MASALKTGRHILIVVDDVGVSLRLTVMLEEIGCTVDVSKASIEGALIELENGSIDCVFLSAKLFSESSAPIADVLVSKSIPFVIIAAYEDTDLPTVAMKTAPRLIKPLQQSDVENILPVVFG